MRAGPPPGERGQGRFAASRLVGPSNGRTVIGPPRGTRSPRENVDRTGGETTRSSRPCRPGHECRVPGNARVVRHGKFLGRWGAFTTVPARRPLGGLL